jgi:hypothetical protein
MEGELGSEREMEQQCIDGREEGAIPGSVSEATTYPRRRRVDHFSQAHLRLR